MFSAAEIAPPMLEAGTGGSDETKDEIKASPDLLDEIDAEIQRTGLNGNAAHDLMNKYSRDDGELNEESAKRLLAELRKMPDARE